MAIDNAENVATGPLLQGARREQRRAGGVHAAVDGVARRRRRGEAAEAAAGGGVRLVRAVQRVHGVHAGRLLPHGVRRHLRVGERGRAARGGTLLAGDGARDGELDRRLRRRARPKPVHGRRRQPGVRQDHWPQPGVLALVVVVWWTDSYWLIPTRCNCNSRATAN